MSPAGDAAVTLSAQTGLSYTSGPGRWVLLVTVLGSAVASIDATAVGIALGVAWFAVCSLLCGLAPSAGILIAARAV